MKRLKWSLLSSMLVLEASLAAQSFPLSSEQLKRIQEGVREIYEMEYDRAEERFQAMIREAPDDPAGYAYLARAYWIRELAGKQELSIDRFASSDFFIETPKYRPNVDPAAEQRFRATNQKAIDKATARLKKNPRDGAALFFRGMAYQNLSSFETSLKRSWFQAMGSGRKATKDHEKLLKLDPSFIDARLSHGVKDYVLGSLPAVWKVILGVIGFAGSKTRGKQTLEAVAQKGALVSDDARILLILIHTREKNYQKAFDYLSELQQKYPHNYLVRLDMAGMQLLMKRPELALGIYGEILRRHRSGERNYAQMERAFLYNRLGVAYREAKNMAEAIKHFQLALQQPGVTARSATVARLELGKTLDLVGRRTEALELYRAVAAAEDVANSRAEAQALLRQAFASGN